MNETDPIGIFLVSSGSNGERLLFRYPEETSNTTETTFQNPKVNPYAVKVAEDYCTDDLGDKASILSCACDGTLTGYSDKDLANLLAVKPGLCGHKFEVKINEVVFVGFPLQIQSPQDSQPTHKREMSTLSSFNVVFALQGHVEEHLVSCYQDLAKHLAIALRHEERRCSYLSHQKNTMWHIQDEAAELPEDSYESPYKIMLKKCQLAKQLKKVYNDLCSSGVVQLYINKWVHVNFCLPHKVHNIVLSSDSGLSVKPEAVRKCLAALRPYHAILLMVEENALLDALPLDSSPSITRLIRVISPLKNLQVLAADADISLGQVFQLATHLVYWGKATIIYPLCESNVYVLGPKTNTFVNSNLGEKFVEQFPGMSLPAIMAEFSLPSPLGEHRDVLGLPQQLAQEVQMVVWMLQHQLLVQLHTYVYLLPHAHPRPNLPRTRHTTLPSLLAVSSSSGSSSNNLDVDSLLTIKRANSASDVASVNSDETYSGAKSPSVEITSEGKVITPETRTQLRLLEQHLTSLTPAQRKEIMNVPASANQEDLKLFAKLCPYFNGQHHLEEIMYYENVRRSQLLTLLDKYRPVLITCVHEDIATACWNS